MTVGDVPRHGAIKQFGNGRRNKQWVPISPNMKAISTLQSLESASPRVSGTPELMQSQGP
jgi:hypothetical protein